MWINRCHSAADTQAQHASNSSGARVQHNTANRVDTNKLPLEAPRYHCPPPRLNRMCSRCPLVSSAAFSPHLLRFVSIRSLLWQIECDGDTCQLIVILVGDQTHTRILTGLHTQQSTQHNTGKGREGTQRQKQKQKQKGKGAGAGAGDGDGRGEREDQMTGEGTKTARIQSTASE